MPKPDLTKMHQGKCLFCPACVEPLHVAVVKQWYVFTCPTCKGSYYHADCRFISTTVHPNPPKKGD